MSHLCDSIAASLAMRRDNVLASNANTLLSIITKVPQCGEDSFLLTTEKSGYRKVCVHPEECGQQHRSFKRIGAANPLYRRGLSEERTLWESSLPSNLPHSLAYAVLCAPPLPLPRFFFPLALSQESFWMRPRPFRAFPCRSS